MATDIRKDAVPDNYKYGWYDADAKYENVKKRGLDENVIREISQTYKKEPQWMYERRLKAFRHYQKRAMSGWGADLSGIDFDEIYYYLRPSGKTEKDWKDVPDYVKRTFDKLGIPEAEQKYLAGVGAQYDCLHEDTLVHTGEGLKPIKAVEPGE